MKRYKTIYILFSIAVATALGQTRHPMTDIVGFEQQLQNATAKITSVRSEFRQEKFMKIFSEKVSSFGVFYYRVPGKISLQYQKPVKYGVIINNGKLQTSTGGKKTTLNLGSNKVMAQMKGLIEAAMVGNISALNKDYKLHYFESGTDYFVKIIPENRSISTYIKEIGITFDRKTLGVNRLRMVESNDDYTDYIFSNQEYNTLNDDEKFRIR